MWYNNLDDFYRALINNKITKNDINEHLEDLMRLFIAAKTEGKLDELCSEYTDRLDGNRGRTNTLLCVACNLGWENLVGLLLGVGANPNNPNQDLEDTPLQCACAFTGSYELVKVMVKMLLSYGADPNKGSFLHSSPLHIACKCGYSEIVEMLLQRGADKADLLALLRIACELGHTEIVVMLLQRGANKVDLLTPLCIACQHGHKDIVAMLLQRGADKADLSVPLVIACKHGHIEIVEILLKQEGANKADLLALLCIACQHGHKDIVAMLLQQEGANKADLLALLCIACQHGHKDIVAMLLQQPGVDINKPSYDGKTPLYIACQYGHKDIVAMLLQQPGVDINNNSSCKGQTALYSACEYGHSDCHIDIIRMLLERGADTNKAGSYGKTPLHVACIRDDEEVVRMLLEQKMDETNLSIALCVACEHERKNIVEIMVKRLLKQGVDINHVNIDGQTPLYIACARGNQAIVKILMQIRGVDINKADSKGKTPLHAACIKGNKELVKKLLKAGAAKEAEDREGFTALARTCERLNFKNPKFISNYVGIIKILFLYGANLYRENSISKKPPLMCIENAEVREKVARHQEIYTLARATSRAGDGLPLQVVASNQYAFFQLAKTILELEDQDVSLSLVHFMRHPASDAVARKPDPHALEMAASLDAANLDLSTKMSRSSASGASSSSSAGLDNAAAVLSPTVWDASAASSSVIPNAFAPQSNDGDSNSGPRP